eukprot:6177165-Pleurochrysis_carterae.AAC.1
MSKHVGQSKQLSLTKCGGASDADFERMLVGSRLIGLNSTGERCPLFSKVIWLRPFCVKVLAHLCEEQQTRSLVKLRHRILQTLLRIATKPPIMRGGRLLDIPSYTKTSSLRKHCLWRWVSRLCDGLIKLAASFKDVPRVCELKTATMEQFRARCTEVWSNSCQMHIVLSTLSGCDGSGPTAAAGLGARDVIAARMGGPAGLLLVEDPLVVVRGPHITAQRLSACTPRTRVARCKVHKEKVGETKAEVERRARKQASERARERGKAGGGERAREGETERETEKRRERQRDGGRETRRQRERERDEECTMGFTVAVDKTHKCATCAVLFERRCSFALVRARICMRAHDLFTQYLVIHVRGVCTEPLALCEPRPRPFPASAQLSLALRACASLLLVAHPRVTASRVVDAARRTAPRPLHRAALHRREGCHEQVACARRATALPLVKDCATSQRLIRFAFIIPGLSVLALSLWLLLALCHALSR